MDKYLVTLQVAIEVEAESFFHAKEKALKKVNIRDGIRAIAVEAEIEEGCHFMDFAEDCENCGFCKKEE